MLCSSVRVTAPRSWSFSNAPGSDSQPAMNTLALLAEGGAFVAAGTAAGLVAAAAAGAEVAAAAAAVGWAAGAVVAAGAGAEVAAGAAVGGADCEHAARSAADPATAEPSKARRLSKRFNVIRPFEPYERAEARRLPALKGSHKQAGRGSFGRVGGRRQPWTWV